MFSIALTSLLLLLAKSSLALAPRPSNYKLTASYDATNFLHSFHFIDKLDDANSGIAHYRDLQAATDAGLAKTQKNQVYLGVDHTNKITGNGGRSSIRLESKRPWHGGLLVADFAHVPAGGCGAWPAFWAVHENASPWQYSEIDIFEAVSLATRNAITLYTSAPCKMQQGYGPSAFIPETARLDCGGMTPATVQDPKKDGWMRGCAVEALDGSFGSKANERGGGVWVLQLDADVIRAWWISRDSIPDELKNGKKEGINPDTWPVDPAMRFKVQNCDVRKAFTNMKLIMNINFCGEYATHAWGGYTGYNDCKTTTGWEQCEAYVRANPEAFKDTYFLINSLRLFERG